VSVPSDLCQDVNVPAKRVCGRLMGRNTEEPTTYMIAGFRCIRNMPHRYQRLQPGPLDSFAHSVGTLSFSLYCSMCTNYVLTDSWNSQTVGTVCDGDRECSESVLTDGPVLPRSQRRSECDGDLRRR
jgi:hypothetical protein